MLCGSIRRRRGRKRRIEEQRQYKDGAVEVELRMKFVDLDNSVICWIVLIVMMIILFNGDPDISDALRVMAIKAAGMEIME